MFLEETGRIAERDRRPPLTPFEWLVDSFWELSTARAIGFGAAPIPAPIIWAYADRFDCPLWFVDVMRAADLQWLARRRAAAAKGG